MSDVSTPPRRVRVDAQRNRDRLLETARAAFARHGVDASLDDIAKTAGVGAGTLYRHFPTRLTLIRAVYFREVEKLAIIGEELAAAQPPLEALRSWMRTFVTHVQEKHLIASALDEAAFAEAGVIVQRAMKMLTQRAINNRDLRSDTIHLDLLRPLIGVLRMGHDSEDPESALRLVDILLRGAGNRN